MQFSAIPVQLSSISVQFIASISSRSRCRCNSFRFWCNPIHFRCNYSLFWCNSIPFRCNYLNYPNKIYKIAIFSHKNGLYIQDRGHSNNSYPFFYYNFTFCNRNAFNTTETELNAIAAPASQGAKKPTAATGIPTEL